MTELSVIIPCYYSENSISNVVEETVKELEKLNIKSFEFILVNDGSADNTFGVIEALCRKYSFVKGIDLAKNFGQHNAIIAGMIEAEGHLILGMDDDFQTHPSQIHKLIGKLNEGYDVVYGKFPKRRHSIVRNIFSRLSEVSACYLIDNPKGLKACPMYLIKSFVKDEVVKSQSAYTNLRGLFLRTTSRIANAEIEHFERKNGKSGYTLKKLIRLWSAYINYSVKPVKLIRNSGIALTLMGLVYLLVSALAGAHFANLIAAEIMSLAGVLLFALGLVGEYVARLFMVTTKEPQYVIRRKTSGDKHE